MLSMGSAQAAQQVQSRRSQIMVRRILAIRICERALDKRTATRQENERSFSRMTIHFHFGHLMNAPVLRALAEDPASDRRRLILDAAERSFTRAGFHRTTMQDVAAEAGMSPGNLYRYFPSKDALVAGLCERDRASLTQEFQDIREAPDFLGAFKELGRRHFEDAGRDKAKLCLEIWAEATRNPAIAALQTEFDLGFAEQMAATFEAAKQAGAIHPEVDARFVASIISKLADGLFVRRAVASDFDPEREIAEAFAVIGALLQGTVKFTDPTSAPECTS